MAPLQTPLLSQSGVENSIAYPFHLLENFCYSCEISSPLNICHMKRHGRLFQAAPKLLPSIAPEISRLSAFLGADSWQEGPAKYFKC